MVFSAPHSFFYFGFQAIISIFIKGTIRLNMKMFRYFLLLLFCSGQAIHAGYSINFPGITDSDNLAAAEEYASIYSSYARALAKHYGPAVAMTAHLAYPYGEDNLGSFPGLYIGTGLGASFANTDAIKNDSDPGVTSGAVPSLLPGIGLTLNTGFALSDKWDLRFSFIPIVKFNLESAGVTSGYSGAVNIGNAKLKAGYHLFEGRQTFKGGLTLSGYTTWTKGSINIASDTQTISSRTSVSGASVVNSFNYTVTSNSSWHYFGMGGEIRAWYNLWVFFPYIGYGVGFHTGRFNSTITVAGDIDVTVNATALNETSTASIIIDEGASIPFALQRLFFGFEFKIVMIRIGAEVHFNLGDGLSAASIGAGMQF